MRTGKLPPEMLAALLGRIPQRDPRVLVGSGIGEDAAVLDFQRPPADLSDGQDDRLLIAKTDPITFATDLIGWYAVNVNANDVACTGATPRWFLATALLPETWDQPDIHRLFDQLVEACQAIGVSLVGGHTEITGGLSQPIVVGSMLGEVERTRAIRTGGGQEGDVLILTQGVAVEGTAVLAREAAGILEQRGVAPDTIARAQRLLFEPGISVVHAARVLCAGLPAGTLHSLHDPTEGGLSAGVWEVAEASHLGAVVEEAAIQVLPETRAITGALGLDPLGLLASGALVAAVAPAQAAAAVRLLANAGIPAREVGRLVPYDQGLSLRQADGTRRPWPRYDRDEVARYFAGD